MRDAHERPPSLFALGNLEAMTLTLTFRDTATSEDLRVYLERLQRFGEPEVRLVSRGSTLAVFGCTQAPSSLLDTAPVVLAVRGFELDPGTSRVPIDFTVGVRPLLDRLARADAQRGSSGSGHDPARAHPPTLPLPPETGTGAWAGVLPPRQGWSAAGVIDGVSLAQVAEDGMARIAEAAPRQAGDPAVRQLRREVWGAAIAPGVPAAAAFALETMGFLRGEQHVRVARSQTWTRLDTSRGQILVRSVLS